eukprot:4151051-Pleurochrysis_carterae.AAC.2
MLERRLSTQTRSCFHTDTQLGAVRHERRRREAQTERRGARIRETSLFFPVLTVGRCSFSKRRLWSARPRVHARTRRAAVRRA